MAYSCCIKVTLIVLFAMINANFVQSNPLATNHSRITLKEARNDPCLDLGSDFCRNNGLCYVDDDDNFACQCRYGYIGTYCEIPSCTYH